VSVPSLKKLTIQHLRGSVNAFELAFEPKKKLTIIYGENGTGKSTICDALEFLSKGRVGSLDGRGLGKTNQHWPSVNKSSADVAVTLETVNGVCRATMGKSAVVVQPEGAQPQVEVLRRSQILALLEATPGQRYEAIRRFVDVSAIEASENTLRKLITELNANRDLAAARILENREALIQFWHAAGAPGTDALSWAKTEASREPAAADPELAALLDLETAYVRLAGHPQHIREATAALTTAQATFTLAQEQATAQLATVAQDAGATISVLQAAQHYLQAHPAGEHCPLCGSAEAAQGLAQRVEQRLHAFAALQEALAVQAQAERQVQQAQQHRETLATAARADIAAFEQVRAAFPWSAEVTLPTEPAPHAAKALDMWLAATAALPTHWRQIALARQSQGQFLATLKQALKTYEDNIQGQDELDALLPNLEKALKIVEDERKAFSDALLSKIANEVGRIYEAVHPGEGLNKISLELDPKKRASLEISSNFGGKSGRPPQAYFSQSHLDTLGLCIFLALAGLDDPANTILVLDDVVASVDEPHVERLVEMLYAEAARFRHCIITTHYGPWKHRYKWGWLKHGQCQFVELSNWTQAGGMSHRRTMPDADRLRLLLAENPPDPQLVCAKAGVILEAALDFLTFLYSCAVPRRQEPRYTLGELLPAIRSKLRKQLKVEVLVSDGNGTSSYQLVALEPILNELERIAQVRNVFGCHFNALSFDLLESDALAFGSYVLTLIEALADTEAGWPRSDKSGSYWSNAGETRRLHPLKHPD
jgi:energy-coupling factor transporter ATP-binding protein EcfA2